MKSKEQKRNEAIIRKVKHGDLTIDKKIEKAKSRRGNSEKEIKRLEKLKIRMIEMQGEQ